MNLCCGLVDRELRDLEDPPWNRTLETWAIMFYVSSCNLFSHLINMDLSLRFKRNLFTHPPSLWPAASPRVSCPASCFPPSPCLFLPVSRLTLDPWELLEAYGPRGQDQIKLSWPINALRKLQRCMVWDWSQITFMWSSLLILFLLYWHKLFVSFCMCQVGDRSAFLLWFIITVVIMMSQP